MHSQNRERRQKVSINGIFLTQAFCQTRQTEAVKAHPACPEHPPCKLRPSTMLAPSVQIACLERAECLLRTPKSLVPASRKGSWLLKCGFPEPQGGHFPASESLFSAISNVKISLSSCHAADYGFPLPFFRASRTEGRKNGFSGIGKVKVSKCKGKNGQALRKR